MRSPSSLNLGGCGQAFFFPVTEPTELDGLVPRLQKHVSSARRAPTYTSIKNDFCFLGKLAHSRIELTHWNMNRSRDRPAFGDFFRLADIDNDRFLLGFEFLL